MTTLKTLYVALFAATALGACSEDAMQTGSPLNSNQGKTVSPAVQFDSSADVFVQLFEWRWPDIALECENFLGPHGYAAVQVSPPQEHLNLPEWWARYQPISYKIESRGGTRAEFADMVRRCRAAGVGIYADALTNHMARIGSGEGFAGSKYTEYDYPVPYGYDDFHHCGRNGNDSIADYQDLWEVQNCNLGTLADLDTAKPEVRKKIAAYLNDLLSLGVAGFRLDAAKHIPHEEITAYLTLLDSKPYIFQEVIDRGTEPINARDYLVNGSVTEFKYPQAIFEAFKGGQLGLLEDLEMRAGYLPAHSAIVFVDNHDLQRGHAGGEDILNYKDGKLYDLANVFMLGWPYGYPMVMSSYKFDDSDQGPPQSRPVSDNACTADWVCEHRRATRTGMLKFRKATAGTPVTDWQAFGGEVISFGRGDRGHLVINIGPDTVEGTFITRMAPGEYCNVVAESGPQNDCAGSMVTVDDVGVLQISVPPISAVAILSAQKN